MRQIKFRGKSVKSGQWLYGDLIHNRGSVYIADDTIVTAADIQGCSDFAVYPETVGQYVGVQDINGTDIYEGDFIRRDSDPDQTAEVAYSDTGFFGFGHYTINGLVGWMLRHDRKIDVIGNRWDNPDLLEKGGNP